MGRSCSCAGTAQCQWLCAECLSQEPQLPSHPGLAQNIRVSFLSHVRELLSTRLSLESHLHCCASLLQEEALINQIQPHSSAKGSLFIHGQLLPACFYFSSFLFCCSSRISLRAAGFLFVPCSDKVVDPWWCDGERRQAEGKCMPGVFGLLDSFILSSGSSCHIRSLFSSLPFAWHLLCLIL